MHSFFKSSKTPKARTQTDPRIFREANNSIGDLQDGTPAKFLFIKPRAQAKCELTAYHKPLNFANKLLRRRDAQVTANYVKQAAQPYLLHENADVRQSAHFFCSKQRGSLASITPEYRRRMQIMAAAEGARATELRIDKREAGPGHPMLSKNRSPLSGFKSDLNRTKKPIEQQQLNDEAIAAVKLADELDELLSTEGPL